MDRTKQSTILRVVILALVIFALSGWAYWHYIYSKPERVFDRMLSNMLNTSSLTKTISQEQGNQKLEQTVRLTTQPVQQVHTKNVLNQGNNTVVTTESIGVRDADFVRYQNIETTQKNGAGENFDFSSVLGIWGKLANNPQNGAEPLLLNQTLLGAVPAAGLSSQARKEVLDVMKKHNVYSIDLHDEDAVDQEIVKGRPTYIFKNVSVNPVAYISMLKVFAKHVGITNLEDQNPSDYAGDALKFDFVVDVWSGRLIRIDYKDPQTGKVNRTETYSAYGAQVVVPEPSQSIDLSELQSRLQQVQ